MSTVTLTPKQKIYKLLDQLPPESLVVAERFVEFLYEQAQRERPVVTASGEHAPPYLYPTVAAPPSSLTAWLDLIPGGCGGDALADTEALYDEA
jgi:hypothetical protein